MSNNVYSNSVSIKSVNKLLESGKIKLCVDNFSLFNIDISYNGSNFNIEHLKFVDDSFTIKCYETKVEQNFFISDDIATNTDELEHVLDYLSRPLAIVTVTRNDWKDIHSHYSPVGMNGLINHLCKMECGEQYMEYQDFGVIDFKSTYVKNEDGSFDVTNSSYRTDSYKMRINKLRD